jgi:murein DD-endopeptidase MepM/ murein hydrolase activator NlpD
LAIYRLPFTAYRLPFTAYRLPFAVHCLLLTVYCLLITACRPSHVVEAVVVDGESAGIVAATAVVVTPTASEPVISGNGSAALATATGTAVFLAAPVLSIDDGHAAPATPTAIPTLVPTAVLPTATVTPTPMPTFTPPALPNTSPLEHYWLRRPVAVDGVLWTNKSYPYGHTRGGTLRPHHGVEFDVDRGTELLAVASGTVIVAGDDSQVAYGPETNFYGNLVIIELDSKLNETQPVYVLYGHLSEALVSVGQHVDAEQVIALSGASGIADGPHMHFEVRVGQNDYNSTRNPLLWLYPFPDRGTVAGRVTWPGGDLAYEVPIQLRRVDGPSRYAATTTYAQGQINSDEGWQENFALDDIDAGYYEVVVKLGEEEIVENVWVYPYQTSFLEIVLEGVDFR